MWWWLTLLVVAFLALTLLDVVLARSSTARWEREKRAGRAPRAVPSAPLPTRAAVGVRGTVVQWTLTAVHLPKLLPGPVKAVAGLVVATRQVAAHVRHGEPVLADGPEPLAEEGEPEDAVSLLAGSAPAGAAAGTDGEPDDGRQGLLRRAPRATRRRALRLLHRYQRGPRAAVAPADGDEDPTPR